MIVECYSADVYCDCDRHAYADVGSIDNPATFTGPNKRHTDRARKRAGWVKKGELDICPKCAQATRGEQWPSVNTRCSG